MVSGVVQLGYLVRADQVAVEVVNYMAEVVVLHYFRFVLGVTGWFT